MTPLRDLYDHLKAGKGGDRELDEIMFEMTYKRKRSISTFEQYEPSEQLTPFTSSQDAAVAFGEALLGPKVTWHRDHAGIWTFSDGKGIHGMARHPHNEDPRSCYMAALAAKMEIEK